MSQVLPKTQGYAATVTPPRAPGTGQPDPEGVWWSFQVRCSDAGQCVTGIKSAAHTDLWIALCACPESTPLAH